MSTPAAEDVVAAELVAARTEGRSLTRFPGVIPASMAEAYQIQELAMSRWPMFVVLMSPPFGRRSQYGARLPSRFPPHGADP